MFYAFVTCIHCSCCKQKCIIQINIFSRWTSPGPCFLTLNTLLCQELISYILSLSKVPNVGFVFFWFHLCGNEELFSVLVPFTGFKLRAQEQVGFPRVGRRAAGGQGLSLTHANVPPGLLKWDSLLNPGFWHTHPSTLSPFCCQPLGADLFRSLPVRRLPLARSYPLIPFIIKGVETVGISKCSLCLLKL